MSIESQLAVLTAISERVEKKVDDIGVHNGKQDILVAKVSTAQLSTQKELTEHKGDKTHHPNGSVTTQLKFQWWAIATIVLGIGGILFYVVKTV